MGRCREGMGEPDKAIAHYEEYLKSNPQNAAEVRAKIAKLEAQKAKQKPVVAPPPAERSNTMRLAGYVLVGVGAAGLVAGGVLGGMAMSKQGEVEDAYRDKKLTYPEMQDELDKGDGLELGAIVGLAVGGAALAAGATLVIIDMLGGDKAQQAAWLAPALSPQGAGVTAGWRF